MTASLRRIAHTLLFLGIAGMTLTMLNSVTFQCSSDQAGCLAALFAPFDFRLYESDMTMAQTTMQHRTESVVVAPVVELVSGYALLISVLILIVLECFELYYIRKMVHFGKSFRFR